ncbi:MAG TPA: tripartite tricarboxylate transporter substrate binding protein [Burkholderiales bacterium]|nr:tripartite tricarboxylate transporter substrate binding protein [Burkholderiales bacterium]
MKDSDRKRFCTILAAFPLMVWCGLACAQDYPTKPVRFIVGFPPGGTNDIVARALGAKLTENLKQQFVIENRGGANTAIASELFVRTPPDGYTIMLNAPGHATNPTLMKLRFDPIKDFAFITCAAESQNLVVLHPSFPPKNVKELIAFSKQRPGQINYGSSGVGTTVHLSAELFQFMTGVKWVHIPYKGAGPAVIDLLAGHHVLYFGNVPSVIQHARAGKLRAIAVTGLKRSTAAPDIPTVNESGIPGFEVTTWYGVSAPAKTPRPIIDKLHAEIVRALKSQDLRDYLVNSGADIVGNTPEQYTAFVQNEIVKWSKVIKGAGIKGE